MAIGTTRRGLADAAGSGLSAIEGQGLEIGTHGVPCAARARGIGVLGRSGLTLVQRRLEPFDGNRSVDKPGIAEHVGQCLGPRIDWDLDSGHHLLIVTLVEVFVSKAHDPDGWVARHG